MRVLVLISLALALVGCGNETKQNRKPDAQSSEKEVQLGSSGEGDLPLSSVEPTKISFTITNLQKVEDLVGSTGKYMQDGQVVSSDSVSNDLPFCGIASGQAHLTDGATFRGQKVQDNVFAGSLKTNHVAITTRNGSEQIIFLCLTSSPKKISLNNVKVAMRGIIGVTWDD